MLHVHCGDASANALRRSSLDGEVTVWADVLHEGPTPGWVSRDRWLDIRAAALSSSTDGQLDVDTARERLADSERALERCSAHDEVVLWFDDCLYDQLILIRLLSHFAERDLPGTRLSLICIGEFPGVQGFTGFGQLLPEHMVTLFGSRHTVTEEESRLACAAWNSVCARDPREIETTMLRGVGVLPFLNEALHRFLEEFPSVHNGLSRLEQEILDAVCAGTTALPDLFREVSRAEERPFFGDTYLWCVANRLTRGNSPLLVAEGGNPLPLWHPPANLGKWALVPGEQARPVLNGEADWVTLTGIDRWMGGVHLHGPVSPWRWDTDMRKLVQPARARSSMGRGQTGR